MSTSYPVYVRDENNVLKFRLTYKTYIELSNMKDCEASVFNFKDKGKVNGLVVKDALRLETHFGVFYFWKGDKVHL